MHRKGERNAWFPSGEAIAAVEAYLAGARQSYSDHGLRRTIMLCFWAERPAAQRDSASGKSCTIMAQAWFAPDA